MGRPSKDGKFVNFLMDRALLERFDAVVEIVGKTKTFVLEEALKQYIEPFLNADGDVKATKAVYLKTGAECYILSFTYVMSKKYYKIYCDGDILTVPAGDVAI